MVERRPPQAPPASAQHEDTVAIPVQRPAPSNGAANGAGSGNGKVLPPMPKDAPAGRSATPPPPPPSSKPTAKPAAKPAAKPTTEAGRQARPQVAAEEGAPADPDRRPSSGRQSARCPSYPRSTSAPSARPSGTPRRPSGPRPRRPRAGSRKPEQAKSAAKVKVAETKESPKPSRRARLRMTRIDPWSVMKTAFLLSIALGIVIVVSVFMVWSVLDAADVWSSINQTVRDVLGGESATSFDIEDYLGTRRVVGFAMIVAAVDVVLLTAIATLGAFLYNMSASLLGGIEVTLAEDK